MCSDNDHAVLAVGVSGRHATSAHIRGNELFIEGICVWVVDVVVDTGLVIEAGWLPELLHVSVAVIVVQEVLRGQSDQEESNVVGLKTCIERLEI